jgi:hypothetical protein
MPPAHTLSMIVVNTSMESRPTRGLASAQQIGNVTTAHVVALQQMRKTSRIGACTPTPHLN